MWICNKTAKTNDIYNRWTISNGRVWYVSVTCNKTVEQNDTLITGEPSSLGLMFFLVPSPCLCISDSICWPEFSGQLMEISPLLGPSDDQPVLCHSRVATAVVENKATYSLSLSSPDLLDLLARGSYTRDPDSSSGANIMSRSSKPKEYPSLVHIVLVFVPLTIHLLGTASVPKLLLLLPPCKNFFNILFYQHLFLLQLCLHCCQTVIDLVKIYS